MTPEKTMEQLWLYEHHNHSWRRRLNLQTLFWNGHKLIVIQFTVSGFVQHIPPPWDDFYFLREDRQRSVSQSVWTSQTACQWFLSGQGSRHSIVGLKGWKKLTSLFCRYRQIQLSVPEDRKQLQKDRKQLQRNIMAFDHWNIFAQMPASTTHNVKWHSPTTMWIGTSFKPFPSSSWLWPGKRRYETCRISNGLSPPSMLLVRIFLRNFLRCLQ